MTPQQAARLLEISYSEYRRGEAAYARVTESALRGVFGLSMHDQAACKDFFSGMADNIVCVKTEAVEGYVDYPLNPVCVLAGMEYKPGATVKAERWSDGIKQIKNNEIDI